MDWGLYSFMFPLAVFIASMAMMSGIAGTAFFLPVFILVFPAMGEAYEIQSASGMVFASLLTSSFGFLSGMAAYFRMDLINFSLGRKFLWLSVPMAVLGALACMLISVFWVKSLYGVLILMMAINIWIISKRRGDGGHDQRKKSAAKKSCFFPGFFWVIMGGFMTGLLSVGIGETAVPRLMKDPSLPVGMVTGTSVYIVFVTMLTAESVQLSTLLFAGGIEAIPWNLVLYTIPGVVIGAQIGPRIHHHIRPLLMKRMIAAVFFFIGVVMLYSVLKTV